ncbi:MAG: hypothetical protein HYV02_07230 [Deltaproteobacteria bacterium]|nr:hypothetical protein [Deltaproteobacteria bacterium]
MSVKSLGIYRFAQQLRKCCGAKNGEGLREAYSRVATSRNRLLAELGAVRGETHHLRTVAEFIRSGLPGFDTAVPLLARPVSPEALNTAVAALFPAERDAALRMTDPQHVFAASASQRNIVPDEHLVGSIFGSHVTTMDDLRGRLQDAMGDDGGLQVGTPTVQQDGAVAYLSIPITDGDTSLASFTLAFRGSVGSPAIPSEVVIGTEIAPMSEQHVRVLGPLLRLLADGESVESAQVIATGAARFALASHDFVTWAPEQVMFAQMIDAMRRWELATREANVTPTVVLPEDEEALQAMSPQRVLRLQDAASLGGMEQMLVDLNLQDQFPTVSATCLTNARQLPGRIALKTLPYVAYAISLREIHAAGRAEELEELGRHRAPAKSQWYELWLRLPESYRIMTNNHLVVADLPGYFFSAERLIAHLARMVTIYWSPICQYAELFPEPRSESDQAELATYVDGLLPKVVPVIDFFAAAHDPALNLSVLRERLRNAFPKSPNYFQHLLDQFPGLANTSPPADASDEAPPSS